MGAIRRATAVLLVALVGTATLLVGVAEAVNVAPTITVSPPSPDNKYKVQWEFTTSAGRQASCQLTYGGTAVFPWADCTSPAKFDITGRPDGTYTFHVRHNSDAANPDASPIATSDYVLDTTSVVTITTAPTSPGNDTTPTWEFTSEPGATFKCILRFGGLALFTHDPCTSPMTYPPLAADGTYTFEVDARDAIGNKSLSVTSGYVLDTVPPATPVITSNPGATGGSQSVSWSFTHEGASALCSISRDGVEMTGSGFDAGTCTSPKSYSLPSNGTYTFSVRAVDAAGNQSTAATHTYVLVIPDTTPPPAPTITGVPTSPGNDTTPTWTFTAEDGATTTCRLLRGGTVVDTTSPCGSSYTPGPLTDGDYTFEVWATDAAGNEGPESTGSYTLDATPPPAPVFTSEPPSPSTATTVTWTFTTEEGSTTTCELTQGDTIVSPLAPCDGSFTFTLPGDGTYTLSVRATDAVGNAGLAATSGYTRDTGAPLPPAFTSEPTSPGNTTSVSWAFTPEAGSTTQCQLAFGDVVVSPFSACTSPATYTLTNGDGLYTFSVRATDSAGNTGAPAESLYLLDTAPPAPPVITGSPATPDNLTSVSWSFVADDLTTTSCRLSRNGTVVVDWTGCASPQAYTLTAGDGLYTFAVRATDRAGNTGPETTSGYTLDTTPPPPPAIDAGPASPGNQTSVAWAFTAEPGSTTECQLSRNGSVISAFTGCTSPMSYLLDTDATYTFEVRATDAVGNTGSPASAAYLLDTNPPASPAIVAGPTSPGNLTTVSWSFLAPPDAVSTWCELTQGGTVIAPLESCVSPKSYTLPSDGTFVFSVTARDAAGNDSTPATATYVRDTVAPDAPVLTSSPVSPGTATSVSWSFTAEPGSSTTCQVTRDGAIFRAFAACSSPASYTLDGGDGTYVFSVRATDAAGNTGPATASTYVLDTTAPVAPVIVSSPPSPDNATSVSWAFTIAEPGVVTECRLTRDGVLLSDFTACSSPVAYTLDTDGLHTFSVRATDAAGNVGVESSATYVLDRVAPAPPAITAAPSSPGNVGTVAWSFSAEPGSTTSCQLERDGTVIFPFAGCSSPQSYTLSGDGTYTFSVRATDAAGNVGAPATSQYVFDTTPPGAPAITSSPSSPGNVSDVSWSFDAEPGSTTTCRLERVGAPAPVFTEAACSSPASFSLAAQPDGTYVFSVRATDAAGNTGAVSTSTYVLDRVAPLAPTLSTSPASPGNDTTPTWAFTGEVGGTLQCQLTMSGSAASGFLPCTSPFSATLAADGSYLFEVRTVDAAGNVGPVASSSYLLDTGPPPAPQVTDSPGLVGNDPTPTWIFSSEAGATFTCQLLFGTTIVSPPSTCSTARAYDLAAQPDGTYTFVVFATDAAGNVSGVTEQTYRLDRVPPAPPAITAFPQSPSSEAQPAWSFGAAESGSVVQCRFVLDEIVVRDWAPCTGTFSTNLFGYPIGTYAFQVRAVDAAGNVSATRSSPYVFTAATPVIVTPPPAVASSEPAPPRVIIPTAPQTVDLVPLARAVPPPPLPLELEPPAAPVDRAAELDQAAPILPVVPEPEAKSPVERVVEVATVAAQKTAFPLLLLLFVILFLIIQDRIDRRDPKLAVAPVYRDPDLDFLPPSAYEAAPDE